MFSIFKLLIIDLSFLSSLAFISVFMLSNKSLIYPFISIFANSDTNFVLLHTMFPSVSTIINGIGEYIKLFFAAEFTFSVRSCKCCDISLFLLLFAKYVYPKIAINIFFPS